MRDGIELAADVYLPHPDQLPAPVIVSVTPYGKDGTAFSPGEARFYQANGYAYVSVDTRGRGKSEGSWHAFVHDADDTHDVIEWAGTQDWSTGAVGTTGLSYMTLSHSDLLHTPRTIADSPDEVRQVVRQLLAAGADVIKVATSGGVLSENDSPRHPQFQPDELAALLAETTDAEVRVMAHAQAREGIRRAVEAGVASIEHGIYLDRELAELMAERGTFLVPTLVAPHAVIAAGEAGASIPAHQVAKAREVVQQHTAAFQYALDAGVRIAMSSRLSPGGWIPARCAARVSST